MSLLYIRPGTLSLLNQVQRSLDSMAETELSY